MTIKPQGLKPDSDTPYSVQQPSPSAVLLFPSDQLNEIMYLSIEVGTQPDETREAKNDVNCKWCSPL